MNLNKIFLINLLRLARFDKPIGIFLLLWPTLTALWVASNQLPDIKLIVIFTVGTILMRSAGCIANDLADQSIDKSVKRTKNRQLVLKNITNQTAFIFLLSLLPTEIPGTSVIRFLNSRVLIHFSIHRY